MHIVRLVANRPLSGNYGFRLKGQLFETDNITADQLERQGLARRYIPPPPPKIVLPTFTPPPSVAPPVLEKMYTPRSTQPPVSENKMLRVFMNKVEPLPAPSRQEPIAPPELPIKRGRGRPKGSKNKS